MNEIINRDTADIFGIKIDRITMESAVSRAETLIENGGFIFTPNALITKHGFDDPDFAKILNSSDLNLPDGQGVLWAARVSGQRIQKKLAGVDFAVKLAERLNQRNGSLFILGGSEKNMRAAVLRLHNTYPALRCGGKNGYFTDEREAIEQINSFSPDAVFVCLGSPKQEYFIYNNISKFKKGVFVGLGGTVDILSGKKKRAPRIVVSFSLEWLWRIITEPKRLAGIPELFGFVTAVLRKKHQKM